MDEFSTAYYLIKEWHDKEYVKSIEDMDDWISTGGMASVLVSGSGIDYYLNSVSSEYAFVVDPLYMESLHETKVMLAGVSISKYCSCPERVMMFLEWLHSSQEAYDLFVYGVENRNYVLNGDRISLVSEEYDIRPIKNRDSVYYFRDFRYDRLYGYQPDEYKDIYRNACLENVMTTEELSEKVMGISLDDAERFYNDRETVQELLEEQKDMWSISGKYTKNMDIVMKSINKGMFLHEPSSIVRMQEETEIEKVVEYFKRLFGTIRGE